MRGTVVIVAVLVAALAAGCGRAPAGDDANRVAITVTDDGFEPAVVTIPAGKRVTLVVTRRSDQTCATDFVMKDRGINTPLPLDRPVEIALGPEPPGDLHYACAMDMFRGTVRVK